MLVVLLCSTVLYINTLQVYLMLVVLQCLLEFAQGTQSPTTGQSTKNKLKTGQAKLGSKKQKNSATVQKHLARIKVVTQRLSQVYFVLTKA